MLAVLGELIAVQVLDAVFLERIRLSSTKSQSSSSLSD